MKSMIGLEIVKVMVLFMIALEGALLLYDKKDEDTELKIEKGARTSRREVYGTFQNPLGDSYRKNRGLYVPIKPNSKMLDGDDEEDEV